MPINHTTHVARAAMRAQRWRLLAVGAIFVAVQALIVLFSWVALEVVDVARAYAGGEGFYSKAQNLSRKLYSAQLQTDWTTVTAAPPAASADRQAHKDVPIGRAWQVHW